MNLMDMLKDQVFNQVTGQIGKHLGESEQATKSGLDALLPTILGGLVKQATTNDGAESLSKTLDQDDFDGGLLDNLGGMLSSGNAAPASNLSSGLLSTIFGDKVSAVISLISKFTGMGGKSTSSLMGLALPLVMSFLGKQKRSNGLDVGGLTSLLMGQKDHIAAALPPGIGDEMGLGALGIAGPSLSDSAPKAAAPTSPAPTSSAPSSDGGGMMKILAPLVIVALLGLLAYNFLGGGAEVETPNVNVPDMPDMADMDIDMGVAVPNLADVGLEGVTTKLEDSFSGLTDIFGGITDSDSATASLDKLKSADEGLGAITSGLSAAPDGIKSGVMKVASGLIPGLTETIDKVMAIPGVGDILKPVVDSLKAKLGLLAA